MAEELSLIIRARDATKRAFSSIGQGLTNLGRQALVMAAGAIAGFGAMIKLSADTEMAQKKLAAVIKATGGALGLTSQELNEHAAALQKTTNFTADTVNETQAVLATFKEVKGDTFKRATEAILDMSTVLGQDARSGAIQLGKALNDPVAGITALRRVGVQFTREQEKQIKTLIRNNDILGAQDIILRELEGQMGGTAAAARDTLGGSLIQVRQSFEEAIKSINRYLGSNEKVRNIAEKVAGVFEQIAEDGFLALWAKEAAARFDELQQKAKAVVGPLQKIAAFAGGFAGSQGTIQERLVGGFEQSMGAGNDNVDIVGAIKETTAEIRNLRNQ